MARTSLGAIVNDVRGRIGQEVATRGRGGIVLKRLPNYKYPTIPILQEQQQRMKAVMAAYNTLTHAQAMQWNAYAAGLTRTAAVSGETYHPTGQNVFVGLASKFLQITPDGVVPVEPPPTEFLGDRFRLTLTGKAGAVVFTASGANTPPFLTELLLQPLKTPRRSPTQFYKSLAFVGFADGAEAYRAAVPAGWVAGAYRFVNPATGQATLLQPLGVVEVTG